MANKFEFEFKCGEKCECGGTFVLHIDGKPLGK